MPRLPHPAEPTRFATRASSGARVDRADGRVDTAALARRHDGQMVRPDRHSCDLSSDSPDRSPGSHGDVAMTRSALLTFACTTLLAGSIAAQGTGASPSLPLLLSGRVRVSGTLPKLNSVTE